MTALDILLQLEHKGTCAFVSFVKELLPLEEREKENDDHLDRMCFVCGEEYDCYREEWTWEYTPKHAEDCALVKAIESQKRLMHWIDVLDEELKPAWERKQ